MNGLPVPKSSADFPNNPEYENPNSANEVLIPSPYFLYKESFSPLIKDSSFSMILILGSDSFINKAKQSRDFSLFRF